MLIDETNGNYIKDINPIKRYQEIDNSLIKFYLQINHLKNIYRQGWLKARIGIKHKNKCESVADHSFGMAILALSIIEKYKLKLDILKCIKMCLIHEFGEVYAGDFTPFDNITKKDKYEVEKKALRIILESIDFDNDFMKVWEEFEERKTSEAQFVKNIDELEFLLQATSYGLKVESFTNCLSKITDIHCKEIALNLIEITKNNKKPKKEG